MGPVLGVLNDRYAGRITSRRASTPWTVGGCLVDSRSGVRAPGRRPNQVTARSGMITEGR
jgi:hypothetical protein